jgi:hypothetical protein
VTDFFNNVGGGGFGRHPQNGHLLGMITKITIFLPDVTIDLSPIVSKTL